jgi:biopolymer transport protein TolR
MAAQQQDDAGMITGINVTPLVDIVLVLLIIFMVTAKLITDQLALKVNLPKASTGEPASGSLFAVTLPNDGKMYLNGKEIDERGLTDFATQERQAGRNPKVIVSGDSGLSYGKVVRVLDLVRNAGISDYAITVQGQDEAQ